MTDVRAEKVARIASDVPELEVMGEQEGDLLVLGWGSTLGAITGPVKMAQKEGLSVSQAHLRYINPFPANLGEILGRFKHVLVPEMNCGQLSLLLRARYLKDVKSFTKVEGKPFYRNEILKRIHQILEGNKDVN